MKLKDYFETQSKIKLSEEEKIAIFEDIMEKNYKKSLFYRINFYVRVFVFTLFFVFLAYIIYPVGINFLNKNNKLSITYIGTGIFVKENNEEIKPSEVLANEIGKILNLTGNVYLIQNGEKKKLEDVLVLDKDILLSKNSILEFAIGTGTYIKILGPAKFKVYLLDDNNNKNYILNIIEGDYVKVKANQIKDNILLKFKDIEIENKDFNNIDFEITTDKNKKIIKNKGNSIIVKRSINNKKVVDIIPAKKDIEIIKNEVKISLTDIKHEVRNKKVSIEFKKGNTGENFENILDTDIKIVPSEKQLLSLDRLLYSQFLKKNIVDIAINYVRGEEAKLKISKQNLVNKILKIYNIMGLKIDGNLLSFKIDHNKDLTMDEIYLLIDQLVAKLKKTYYLPNKYIIKLNKIEAWIYLLKSKKVGSMKIKKNINLKAILDFYNIGNKSKLLEF